MNSVEVFIALLAIYSLAYAYPYYRSRDGDDSGSVTKSFNIIKKLIEVVIDQKLNERIPELRQHQYREYQPKNRKYENRKDYSSDRRSNERYEHEQREYYYRQPYDERKYNDGEYDRAPVRPNYPPAVYRSSTLATTTGTSNSAATTTTPSPTTTPASTLPPSTTPDCGEPMPALLAAKSGKVRQRRAC